MKGCDLCPTSEDVWLEAARLQTPEHAKALLARGVSYNQTSVKLWIQVGTLHMLSATTADQACDDTPFCEVGQPRCPVCPAARTCCPGRPGQVGGVPGAVAGAEEGVHFFFDAALLRFLTCPGCPCRLPGWSRTSRQSRGCCGGRWRRCQPLCAFGRPPLSSPAKTMLAFCSREPPSAVPRCAAGLVYLPVCCHACDKLSAITGCLRAAQVPH